MPTYEIEHGGKTLEIESKGDLRLTEIQEALDASERADKKVARTAKLEKVLARFTPSEDVERYESPEEILGGRAGILLTRAALTKGGKAGDVAIGVGGSLAGVVGGTLAAPVAGPGAIPAGGMAGSAAAEKLVQAREFLRGERDEDSPGRLLASTATGAFVPGKVAAAATPLATAGKTLAVRGQQGMLLGAAHEAISEVIDEKRFPNAGRVIDAGLLGLLFGGAFGSIEAAVPHIGRLLKGKTVAEAKTALAQEAAKPATPEAAEAIKTAQERIDEMLRIGAPAKKANERAQRMALAEIKSAPGASTEGSTIIRDVEGQPKSIEVRADGKGEPTVGLLSEPRKPAKESAGVLATELAANEQRAKDLTLARTEAELNAAKDRQLAGAETTTLEGTQAGTPALASSSGEAGRPSIASETSVPLPRTQAEPSQTSAKTLPPDSTLRTKAPSEIEGPSTTREVGSVDDATGRMVIQPTSDVKSLLDRAAAALPKLEERLTALTDEIPGIRFVGARAKGDTPRLREKMITRPPETISDYVGARVAFDTEADVEAAITRLGGQVLEDENFLNRPKAGYRARHVQIMTPEGLSVEIQFMPHEIAEAQKVTHKLYKALRASEVDSGVRQKAVNDISRMMDDAWEKYQNRVGATEPTLSAQASRTLDIEGWADGVLRDRGVNRGGLFSPDPEMLAAMTVKGAAIVGRGVKDFAKWSATMVKEFGESIQPHLKAIWDDVGKGAEHVAGKARAFVMASENQDDVPMTLGQAEQALKNPAQAKFEGRIRELAPDAVVIPTIGKWENTAENSALALLPNGDEAATRRIAAQVGLENRQLAVLHGVLDENGPDAMYVVRFPKGVDLKTADAALNEAGFKGASIHQTPDGMTVRLFDKGAEQVDSFIALQNHETSPSIEAVRVRGELLGADTRDAAAGVFNHALGEAEGRRGQGERGTGVQGVRDESLPLASKESGRLTERVAPPAKARSVQLKGKPLPASVGGELELVHYSGRSLDSVDPSAFGQGGATPVDRRGANKSFFFLQDSPIGGDGPIVRRSNRYQAKVSGDRIYDADADPLGWASAPNRLKADEMLMEAGYAGLARQTYDGRNVVALFEPVAVRKAPPRSSQDRAFVDPRFLLSTPAQSVLGGTAGAAYGSTQGDTPEERRENMLKFGALGAGVGAAGRVLARGLAGSGSKGPKLPVDEFLQPVPGKPLMQRIREIPNSIRTATTTVFAPLDRLEPDIARANAGVMPLVPRAIPLSKEFEQVAGSTMRAFQDVRDYKTGVLDAVGEKAQQNFSRLVTLRRIGNYVDEGLPFAGYDRAKVDTELAQLKALTGPAEFDRLTSIAEGGFQREADDALRLQVQSGRLSQEAYDAIKAKNDFYSPFKVLEYAADDKGFGGGRAVDTRAQLAKRREGTTDTLHLENPSLAMGQHIWQARILADKNLKMLELAKLADVDPSGSVIRKLGPNQEPRRGREIVNYFEDGKPLRLEVAPEIAEAVKGMNHIEAGILAKMASGPAGVFRFGATTANLGFQPFNFLAADQPTLWLASKYGIKADPAEIARVPIDIAHGMYASMFSNLLGGEGGAFERIGSKVPGLKQANEAAAKLAREFYESGAANSNWQQMIETIGGGVDQRQLLKALKLNENTLVDSIGKLNSFIEESTKMMGFKRGLRIEGIEKMTPAQQQEALKKVVAEVRNFAGSPDFFRGGTYTRAFNNTVQMFLNARVQGLTNIAGRAVGADGGAAARNLAIRTAAGIGIPAAAIWYVNHQPENKEDYEARSDTERNNYFLYPRYDDAGKPLYSTNERGEKIREYWRFPKRELGQYVGNTTEAALEFANEKNPEQVKKFAVDMLENLSPVNIHGRNSRERIESVIGGANPALKVPYEVASGRDTFRHRDILATDDLKRASPGNQYTETTPKIFVKAAHAMPDAAPDALRSPLILQHIVEGLSGRVLTQFVAKPQPEGRDPLASKVAQNPVVGRVAGPLYVDREAENEALATEQQRSADLRIESKREAHETIARLKTLPAADVQRELASIETSKPELLELINREVIHGGKDPIDLRVKGLSVKNGSRARFIAGQIQRMKPEDVPDYLARLAEGPEAALTQEVAEQLAVLASQR